MAEAPYKRIYKHARGRGSELIVVCSFCGKKVPRYKAFTKLRGFYVSDPSIKKELSNSNLLLPKKKIYICPQCARHRRISQPGKSKKSRRKT
jgi:ribosomal protein S26